MALKNKFLKKLRIAESGFTMIELLTVAAIIAVITALSVANYRNGNRMVVLGMQAHQFAQDLRKMQEWSVAAHEVPLVSGSGSSSMPGYGVYVGEGSSYKLYTDNNDDKKFSESEVDVVLQTVALDPRLEISECTPDPASINFIPPDPSTKIVKHSDNSHLQTASVVFRIKDTLITRTVKINKAGLIYVE